MVLVRSSFGTLASLRMTPSPRESEDLTEHSELPELHALFCFYDDAFFYSALQSVEVRWSTKMTLCAGLCVYNVRSKRACIGQCAVVSLCVYSAAVTAQFVYPSPF